MIEERGGKGEWVGEQEDRLLYWLVKKPAANWIKPRELGMCLFWMKKDF
jgi:hypothetical protein